MAEAKVFPMSTFVATLRGGDTTDAGVQELLSHVTQAEMDPDFVPFAAALSKGWIYEQSPELTKYSKGEVASLGQKVSIEPMEPEGLSQAQAVLEQLKELKKTNAEQTARIDELEKENKNLSNDLAAAKSSLKKFEKAAAQGEQKVEVSSKKLDDYLKKLEELLAQIDQVKKEGVVVAGAAGEGGAPAAGGESEAPASEAGDDFGFGGGGSDPFADSNW